MVKGGLAAAAIGLMAIVAAFTVPLPLLHQYTGMGTMGVSALGVIFFYAAFLFARGRWWAGIPAIIGTGFAAWVFIEKAVRLLMIYYKHNPIITLGDFMAPFPFLSFQLVLIIITSSLGYFIFKALKFSRTLSPQPISKSMWGAMGLWVMVVVLDSMI